MPSLISSELSDSKRPKRTFQKLKHFFPEEAVVFINSRVMKEIIIVSPEELATLVEKSVSSALESRKPHKAEPDPMDLNNAVRFLREQGYPTSKAKIYKLTSSGHIPFRKYGNRLVFSRKELLAWAESQTVNPGDHSESVLAVSRSAGRKLNK